MSDAAAGLTVGVLADRVGYEERVLLAAARAAGARPHWLDDGRLCTGPRGIGIPRCDVYLIRSRAYTRGAILAGLLEDRGKRAVNTSAAITLCQDKLSTARCLHAAGIATLDFRVVLSRADLRAARQELGLPLVLKPLLGGLGSRVLLVRDADLLEATYDYVEHYGQGYDRLLLAQPFQPGADLRAVVIGGEVIAAIEREPHGDWRGNVATGARPIAVQPTLPLRRLASRVAEVTGAELFGLDVFRDESHLVVGELNHVPRFRGLREATGADVAGAIVAYLTRSQEGAARARAAVGSAGGGGS